MIIPTDSLSWIKVWKKPGLDATSSAISTYLDSACDQRQCISVHTANVLEEAREKGQYLNSIICSLSYSKYLVKGTVNTMDKSYSEAIDKVSRQTVYINEFTIFYCICFSHFLRK